MKVNTSLIKILFLTLVSMISWQDIFSQAVPGKDENIPFLVTFGRNGETSWGDDDFSSIFFFTIPKDYNRQFYIKVFDPDAGGQNDEIQGIWDSRTMFSVYGGKGVDPDKNLQSRGLKQGDNFKSGNLLASRVFGNEAQYDNNYYAFGPFNPTEGEYNEKWKSYIFKIVCEGITGDDGNLYRYFKPGCRQRSSDRRCQRIYLPIYIQDVERYKKYRPYLPVCRYRNSVNKAEEL